MGAWDGAEVCDLIGLFMLSQLTHLKIVGGLFRADGLAVSDATSRQVSQMEKKICEIFRKNDLKITIDGNKKSVNYLDITLDLTDFSYKPYIKTNDIPNYVHNQSNHLPSSIIKNLPASINRRLSTISANEEIFNEAAPIYQDALRRSGYEYQLKFDPPIVRQK